MTMTRAEDITLTYPGWELDKEQAEKLFVEYSASSSSSSSNSGNDCFRRKVVAMKNKQKLFEGDRSHPDIRALDAGTDQQNQPFTYPGWQLDKAECERRHTGDCILLHLGSYGFHDLLDKMKRKQALHNCSHDDDRSSVAPQLAALDVHTFTYPSWRVDKELAEKMYIDYNSSTSSHNNSASDDSSSCCFSQKVRGMKNKQRLHEGDRSHPELLALDALTLTYNNHKIDWEEAMRRHTGDCRIFNLGAYGFESHLNKMKKKQQVHTDRASVPGLQQLDATQFTFPGWEHDKSTCEKYFVEYSSIIVDTNVASTLSLSTTAPDCFHRKIVAMNLKERLHLGDRQSNPNIVALDATVFTYDGWHYDKTQAERRLTGDCILLHMGSIGFNDIFSKMKKKQALHMDRSSIACLRDLDALGPSNTNTEPLETSNLAAKLPTAPSATTQAPTTAVEQPTEKSVANSMANNKCVVCLDNQITHAYIPCGHLCVCGDCVKNYDSACDKSCPLCREQSYCVTKIYC